MRVAHEEGMNTSATMLIGHIEFVRDRIEHMSAIRDMQDYAQAGHRVSGFGVRGSGEDPEDTIRRVQARWPGVFSLSPTPDTRHPTPGTRHLKMRELAQASGVSSGTIKHYLREGLLPEPVKTSRNMAYYPADFVDRIRLIKQLQEERFMPLKVIKGMLDQDPDRAIALVELEDRILERALAGEDKRTSAAEVRRRYNVPQEVLKRLEELEILSPNSRGYSPSDVRVVEAISRFRAGGYDEQIGFTVYDTLRYKRVLQDLVKEEVSVLMERLAGEMDTDEAVDLIEAGSAPLQDLIAALHSKLLIAELQEQRAARG
jgi:DNA-binding transcriptional MerR regulator